MNTPLRTVIAAAALGVAALPAAAADWSDTSIGWRYGTDFREPFNTQDIKKNIFNLTHVSGYKYGTNFFNVDGLLSDSKDPSSPNSPNGAQEVYIVYRHTLSLNKVSGKDYKWGVVKDWGLVAGFDFNTKDDAGYNSKKRMLVLGPNASLGFGFPGFLNVGVLALWESNAPCNEFTNPQSCVSRYDYKTHPALDFNWFFPLGSTDLSFEGWGMWIASKGRNEFGGSTATETNLNPALMWDIGKAVGGPAKTFKVGFIYQYWRNKFGNDYKGPAGSGAFAKTPMIRAAYHF